jgi:hypothetical protein
MGRLGDGIIALLTSVLGVAIVAVFVSKNAQTATIIQQFGSSFSSIIGAAVSPVTGTSSSTASLPSLPNLGG